MTVSSPDSKVFVSNPNFQVNKESGQRGYYVSYDQGTAYANSLSPEQKAASVPYVKPQTVTMKSVQIPTTRGFASGAAFLPEQAQLRNIMQAQQQIPIEIRAQAGLGFIENKYGPVRFNRPTGDFTPISAERVSTQSQPITTASGETATLTAPSIGLPESGLGPSPQVVPSSGDFTPVSAQPSMLQQLTQRKAAMEAAYEKQYRNNEKVFGKEIASGLLTLTDYPKLSNIPASELPAFEQYLIDKRAQRQRITMVATTLSGLVQGPVLSSSPLAQAAPSPVGYSKAFVEKYARVNELSNPELDSMLQTVNTRAQTSGIGEAFKSRISQISQEGLASASHADKVIAVDSLAQGFHGAPGPAAEVLGGNKVALQQAFSDLRNGVYTSASSPIQTGSTMRVKAPTATLNNVFKSTSQNAPKMFKSIFK